MMHADLTGQTLGGRYDLLERLGVGGMGAVYRARDRELDEIVALKVIRDELARDPAMIERFRREVKLARRVTHHNVARTFELVRADDVVFCTMELIDGESLTSRLARDRFLPVPEAVAIAAALCDGLAAAHAAGVVHRDVKPDNVLLARDGRVVMADFGIAAPSAGAHGEASGTPAYMAPEQARGEPATAATDTYAIGLVLHEMLTGRRVFEGSAVEIVGAKQQLERVTVAADEAPAELAEVIGRATARDPAARFASAADLRAALMPWTGEAPRPSLSPRIASGHDDVATVVVLAPRGDDARIYLAEAVYDELLAHLMRRSRLRVLPRGDTGELDATVVRLVAGDQLSVTIEAGGRQVLGLQLPLMAGSHTRVAEAIAGALRSQLAIAREPAPDPTALEALDLMMQARHNIRRNIHTGRAPIEQMDRAHELLPNDPQVAATRAMIYIRHAFFQPDAASDVLVRAAELAHSAIAAAPNLADAYLALGHVELHTGNPLRAAAHYRGALALAPHSAEAHEYLGRMLLEAGYLDRGMPRMQEAIAISPSRRGIGWEIARAWALEQRWDDHDRLIEELRASGIDRAFVRARHAAWRRENGLMDTYAKDMAATSRGAFVPGLLGTLVAVYTDQPWPPLREKLLELAFQDTPNHRRRTFVAQLAAEGAGWAGDVATCVRLVAYAVDHGLFDLHWLERCSLLTGLRASADYARLRDPIRERAEAILDALYGDHDLGTSATAIAVGLP